MVQMGNEHAHVARIDLLRRHASTGVDDACTFLEQVDGFTLPTASGRT